MKKIKNILSIELVPLYLEKVEFEQNKNQIKDIVAKMIILGMKEEAAEKECENKNSCEIVSTLTR